MNAQNTIAISICIPVYKNISYLKRLLDSIAIQTYTDYEIIITDDTPDDSVKDFIKEYVSNRPVRYFKNQEILGTPENWNESIRHAEGAWIKLMHNDDWFSREDALQKFYEAAVKHSDCPFFFSAFQNVTDDTEEKKIVRCNILDMLFFKMSPLHLFKRVYIGNPSCTFIKKDVGLFYDKQFKFVVDFEYYIRCIRKAGKYKYIDEVLLNVGFHPDQVTKSTFLVPGVQIPENLMLLDKLGLKILKNPFVYDYYWRMIRNLKIRSIADIEKYYSNKIRSLIRRMIGFQSKISYSLLQIGIFSKFFMSISYLISLFQKH